MGWWLAGAGWGEDNAKLLLDGHRVSIWNDEKRILEMGGGDGSMAMCVHLMQPNYVLGTDLNGKF